MMIEKIACFFSRNCTSTQNIVKFKKKEKVKQTTLTTKEFDVLRDIYNNYHLAKLITSATHYVAPGHHFALLCLPANCSKLHIGNVQIR